eukprot:1454068-Prymnesium_polylepis.1
MRELTSRRTAVDRAGHKGWLNIFTDEVGTLAPSAASAARRHPLSERGGGADTIDATHLPRSVHPDRQTDHSRPRVACIGDCVGPVPAGAHRRHHSRSRPRAPRAHKRW